MHKRTKLIITVGVAIALVTMFFLINLISKKTYFSDPGMIGNTPGNIYNNGLFCENDGKIFFGNYLDQGTLYSMDLSLGNFKKLYNDYALYINADENYIYYSRNNNKKPGQSKNVFTFYNTGLYRITKNGSKLKTLYDYHTGQLMLYDNVIYYQHYSDDDGLELYRVGIDGNNSLLLDSSIVSPAGIRDNTLYYTRENDLAIHAMNLLNAGDSLLLDARTYMPIPTGEGIYYISTKENYSICRIDYNGENKTKLVDGMCSTYNISNDERYIYFQRDGGDRNGMYVYDTVTESESLIISGDYKWINVTSEYVFFYDFSETSVYVYSLDGALSIFSPPEAETD